MIVCMYVGCVVGDMEHRMEHGSVSRCDTIVSWFYCVISMLLTLVIKCRVAIMYCSAQLVMLLKMYDELKL